MRFGRVDVKFQVFQFQILFYFIEFQFYKVQVI